MFVPITDAEQAIKLYRAGLLWESTRDGYMAAAGWSDAALKWYISVSVSCVQHRIPPRLFVCVEE